MGREDVTCKFNMQRNYSVDPQCHEKVREGLATSVAKDCQGPRTKGG